LLQKSEQEFTRATFQPLMSWLKAAAPRNMERLSVTAPVFQPLTSWLT
jgi:hypothetical protein